MRTVLRGAVLCAAVSLILPAASAAAPGQVAAYAFNEGAGATVADASGFGNHGTATATGWAPMGRFGGALMFNGSSSWVTVPGSPSLDLATGMTLEAWVNPTALGGWRTAIFKHSSSGMVYSLYAHDGSRPTGQVHIGGEQNAAGPAPLPLNTWTHLAATYDRTALRLYVNGIQVASRPQAGSIPASSGVLRIGGNSIWTEYFAGMIDEVRVYDRALTAAEIQTDMTTPVGPPAADTQPPTTPGNLRQTGATATSATIAWSPSTDNLGVAGYGLYRSGGPAGSTASTTATIGGLTCGASEVVGVDARDAAGNRSAQATITVTAEDCPPEVDFVNERVIIGLDEPAALAFTPDGRMLIAERDGVVRIAQPGAGQVDAAPFLQLPSVAHDNERGLLGITLDPGFERNGYVYVFYTHGPTLRNRVSRFQATGNSAPAATEHVVWQNSVAATSWHQGGDLEFGPDGFLYISVGDHLNSPSAQQLSSFNGKILRIAADGSVPVDNPFYDGTGPNADAIWARGLRNPFRFTIDDATGRMIIGDVGEGATEEVNLGARGANYGWPACEGSCGSAGMTNPVHSYPHAGRDASVTGGFVYRGSQFPAEYRGDYFFADYAQNWIKRLSFDAAGNVTGVHAFEPPDGAVDGPYGDIVDLAEGPDGSLWYVDAGPFERSDAGSVRRIRATGGNRPPTAQAAADRTSGAAPLAVRFSSAGSADPEGAPLGYRWDFGDGGTSTEANPAHTFAESGRYTVRLITSDGVNETLSAPIAITAGSAPTARIVGPDDGSGFRAGDVVTFSGEATDPDDGALTGASLSWRVVFHHDGHIHPALDGVTGASGTLTVPDSGHSFAGDTSFEIVLTATDSDGIRASDSIRIEPQKATVSLATTPAGLGLTLDGIARTAPFSQDEAVGFRYAVGAPSPQVAGPDRYTFASWSDGGAQTHAVTVPPGGLALTAAFERGSATLPGLVAAYSFDEGSGTTLADRSGHGHTGAISGATWSAAGRNGGALSFDGSGDSVRVADHADLDLTSAMTLEAWVRPSALGSSWRTVLFKEQASHMTYALYAGAGDGRPTGQAWIGGQRDARGPSTIATAAWTHLAVTYDGTAVRLYVDGALVRTLAATGSMAVSTGPLMLGGNAIWAEWFAGLMDDVRVYGRALTQAEIQSDMGTPVG